MAEEKNSLLGYLLDSPEVEKKIFCREMEENREIIDYSFEHTINSTCNLGKFLKDNDQLGNYIPLFLDTSYDFLRVFFGVIAGKKVCVPIHTISNEKAIEFILKKVRAQSLVVTKPWLYKKLAQISYVREHVHTILTTPEVISQKALPCKHIDVYEVFNQEISSVEARNFIEQIVKNTDADEPMQLVFTSGTTGEPKGAILSHRNVVSCVVRAGNHLKIHSGYRTLTFLPLSHVMAQNEVFIALVVKALVQIVGRDNLLHGMKIFKPNILVAVPRVYQAVYGGIQRKLRHKPKARKLVDFVVRVYTEGKKSPSFLKRICCKLFSKTIGNIITAKIRNNIGRFNLLVTAGAACPPFIYDFFEAIGLPLTNAQGLTEVSGAIIYNSPNETINGSIGYPLKGVDVKIAQDGEMLIKGDPVFHGYFEEPQLNDASFVDGWFRTGDLGKKHTIKGKDYLFLEGRKKEILVLSSGLNIPAVQIEDRLVEHELIHQAMVVGDGKPRLAALIVPNDEYRSNNPNIRNEISKIIRQVNAQMDASEHINQFEIISEPFTVENGMLTPTLKIRRPVIFQRYKEVIGQLYSSPA